LTKRKEKKKKIKKERKKGKIELAIRSTYASSEQIVKEGKSVRISLQKHNKVAKRVSSWIPIAIKSCAIMENMSSRFDGVHTTQAFKFIPREKSAYILQ